MNTPLQLLKLRRILQTQVAAGALGLLLLGAVGCGPDAGPSGSPPHSGEPVAGDQQMSIKVTSEDFEPGARIPPQLTGDGVDHSPQLSWANVPNATQEIALICDDPDAPSAEPWVHWVLYGLDPMQSQLPSGISKDATISEPVSAKQGKNSWPTGQTVGYRGPMPPPGHGTHHYHFRVYALDQPTNLAPGATKSELQHAMAGHILAEGELVGIYARN